MIFFVWINPLTWLAILRIAAVSFLQFTYRIYLFSKSEGSLTFYRWGQFRVSSPKNIKIGTNCQILNDVEFLTAKKDCDIILHNNVKIGKRTQLVAQQGDSLTIGENSSFHSDCSIVGSIHVGRHCLFARHIFMSSYDHTFKTHPHLLIKDQDKKEKINRPIFVHDDCWIGWGVAIKAGITIGKGAIVGANSVVTKNVPPYAIVGGVPAKIIGSRLNFSPPFELLGNLPEHTPYFYSGFTMTNDGALKIDFDSYIAVPQGNVDSVTLELLNPLTQPLAISWSNESYKIPPGEKTILIKKKPSLQAKSNEDYIPGICQSIALKTPEVFAIKNVRFQIQ